MDIKRTLSGKEVFFGLAGMALFVAFMAGSFDGIFHKKDMDVSAAKYEAEKLLAVIDGQPKTAAFIDQVLKNDDSFNKFFVVQLQQAIKAAPKDEPAFKPYHSCLAAGENLYKFAELRKKGGGQNDLSDQYRRPFWDGLDACKKAVGV